MLKWLYIKLFKKTPTRENLPTALLYVPPAAALVLCYLTFVEHRIGDPVTSTVTTAVTVACVLVAITMNLRRFVGTLQKSYDRSNLHAALASIFATVTMFAVMYSVLYLYVPGSIDGFSGATALDECISAVYFSATVFTTVGFGDIHAVAAIARVVAIVEMMSFFVFFVFLLGNHRTFIKPKGAPVRED